MPWNGNGVYSAPASPGEFNPAVATQQGTPTTWNALLLDLTTGLSNAICKDGQTTVTADLPMATHNHTGVGNASARDEYAAAGQVQDSTLTYAADTGAADLYAITLAPVIPAYAVGQLFGLSIAHANATTTPTLAVNGLLPGLIKWPDGSAMAIGYLAASANILVRVASIAADVPTFHLQTPTTPGFTTAGGTITGTLTMSGAAINGAVRVDVASATTTNIGAAASNYIRITGTTTITAFDTVASGVMRWLRFGSAGLVLTHGPAIVLPTFANITTQMGDVALFVSDGTGWKCLSYTRADGTPLALPVGTLVNRAYTENNGTATLSTVIPQDDTIPQVGEGTQVLSCAITTLTSTNRVRAKCVVPVGTDSAGAACVALFLNGGTNAIASRFVRVIDGIGMSELVLEYEHVPGTAAVQTYTVRVGPPTANLYLNEQGSGPARLGGGTSQATITIDQFIAS